MAQKFQLISTEMFETNDEMELAKARGDDKDDGGEMVLVKKTSGMVSDIMDTENLNTKDNTENNSKGNSLNSVISEGMDNNDYIHTQVIQESMKQGIKKSDCKDSMKLGNICDLPQENKCDLPQENKIHQCNKCQFKSKYWTDFLKHMKDNHTSEKQCYLCDYQSEESFAVKEHIKLKHAAIKMKCDQCDFMTFRKSEIQRHKETFHVDNKVKCPLCSFTISSAVGRAHSSIATLYSHKQRFHNKKSCDVCNATFYGTNGLIEHKLKLHKGKVIDCNKCDYKNTNKLKLQRHIKYAHLLKCSQCNYGTPGLCDLQSHLVKVHKMTHRQSRLELGHIHDKLETVVKTKNQRQGSLKENSPYANFMFFGKIIKQEHVKEESKIEKDSVKTEDPDDLEFEVGELPFRKEDENESRDAMEEKCKESETEWNWDEPMYL